jgi:hypothetical protein
MVPSENEAVSVTAEPGASGSSTRSVFRMVNSARCVSKYDFSYIYSLRLTEVR